MVRLLGRHDRVESEGPVSARYSSMALSQSPQNCCGSKSFSILRGCLRSHFIADSMYPLLWQRAGRTNRRTYFPNVLTKLAHWAPSYTFPPRPISVNCMCCCKQQFATDCDADSLSSAATAEYNLGLHNCDKITLCVFDGINCDKLLMNTSINHYTPEPGDNV